MPRGYPYTKEESDYIIAHYHNGKTVAEIAEHLGREEHAIKKWAAYHRNKGVNIRGKVAAVGERRTIRCNTRNCFVIKEKQPDGTWKFIEQTGGVPKVKGRPIGFERQTKYGAIIRKTETGWVHIPKPKSQKKTGKAAVPVGTITTRTVNGNQCQFIKQPSGQWRRLTSPGPKPKPKPKPKTVQPKQDMPRKKANQDPQTKRHTFDHTKNPDKMKIPEQKGGQWVRLDNRTIVYRTNVAS